MRNTFCLENVTMKNIKANYEIEYCIQLEYKK